MMRKIRLNAEDLEVRSFATEPAAGPSGTVHGMDYSCCDFYTCYQACIPRTEEFETCYQTGPTCGASCDWQCDSIHMCPSYPSGCETMNTCPSDPLICG